LSIVSQSLRHGILFDMPEGIGYFYRMTVVEHSARSPKLSLL